MSTWSVTLKTHTREEITDQFPELNPCVIHGCKPIIQKSIAGKRKEVFYGALCCKDGIYSDDCGKISSESAQHVVNSWNKWNPIA